MTDISKRKPIINSRNPPAILRSGNTSKLYNKKNNLAIKNSNKANNNRFINSITC